MILNLHLTISIHSRMTFGQIDNNSSRNKFGLFMTILKNEIDIASIMETKIGFLYVSVHVRLPNE